MLNKIKNFTSKDVKEEITEDTKDKKIGIAVKELRLNLIRGISLLICILSAAAYVFFNKTSVQTKERELYSYSLSADSSYKVFLHENTLFESEALEEDMMYSSKLTKHIEVLFKLNMAMNTELPVSLYYNIKAAVVGSSGSEDAKQVYRKEYVLKEQTIEESNSALNIEERIEIKPEEYSAIVVKAEEELGSTVDTSLLLEFTGTAGINTDSGIKKEAFSYILPLAITSESNLYSITKPEVTNVSGAINVESMEEVPADKKKTVPALVLGVLSLAVFVASLLILRKADKKERRLINVKSILKKYQSRMAAVKSMDLKSKNIIELHSAEELMLIADELQKPVFYVMDEDEMPKDDSFYLYADEFLYIYKEVEEKEEVEEDTSKEVDKTGREDDKK